MPDATLTNAITNALHAAFLLAYFTAALRAHFPRIISGLFFLLFALKIMGVYVHYKPESPSSIPVWAVIAISTLALNIIILIQTNVPKSITICIIALCIGATSIFLTGVDDFIYIALPGALAFGFASAFSKPYPTLSLGFAMVVASNLIWIATRKIGEAYFNGEVPISFRYDNDLYHFLLIASTFIIFQGFKQKNKQKNKQKLQHLTP